MRGTWRIIGLLVLVWAIAGGVILWTRASRPTPASVAAYVNGHSLEGLPTADRAKVIEKVAGQINSLNFDQRQELRKSKIDRRFFEQMTEEERKRFLDLTLPEGFRQLMLALNKMNPEQRKKIVQRALDDIEKDTPEINDRIDREAVQKMISQGMDSFYQEASAEVKLDFAPVIEELQRATQGMR
jgi:Mg/Co/Ni transporter MgtE